MHTQENPMSATIRRLFARLHAYLTRERRQPSDAVQFCMDRPIYGALVAR
ncbi:sensor histidine kinase QseC [Schaalia cardiffensis F0333]|uniref:Sensor histidine kinase QseC n=1 Tax=Schaalia cardiffensis F0333 TaxID=888050 RepID=N6X1V8_9ACTO|nr:sensor histidine kinase QseC [Schaalia cardiffensis F0333]